jgi:hypothetical protein
MHGLYDRLILNASNFHLEVQEFAEPGTYEKLYCKGRPCANCGKCRDWQFTGDLKTWQWIQGWKNWNEYDWNRLNEDQIYKSFEKRSGATCGGHRGGLLRRLLLLLGGLFFFVGGLGFVTLATLFRSGLVHLSVVGGLSLGFLFGGFLLGLGLICGRGLRFLLFGLLGFWWSRFSSSCSS